MLIRRRLTIAFVITLISACTTLPQPRSHQQSVTDAQALSHDDAMVQLVDGLNALNSAISAREGNFGLLPNEVSVVLDLGIEASANGEASLKVLPSSLGVLDAGWRGSIDTSSANRITIKFSSIYFDNDFDADRSAGTLPSLFKPAGD